MESPIFPSGQNPREVTIEVWIDEPHPERKVKIGSGLSTELREELVGFLSKNKDSFAWSAEDMSGIDPNIISHELHVDMSFETCIAEKKKA